MLPFKTGPGETVQMMKSTTTRAPHTWAQDERAIADLWHIWVNKWGELNQPTT